MPSLATSRARRRRDCLGELVQIDGSEHAWFEDRGPPEGVFLGSGTGQKCVSSPVADDAARPPANGRKAEAPLKTQREPQFQCATGWLGAANRSGLLARQTVLPATKR